jgi:hypothetical protein
MIPLIATVTTVYIHILYMNTFQAADLISSLFPNYLALRVKIPPKIRTLWNLLTPLDLRLVQLRIPIPAYQTHPHEISPSAKYPYPAYEIPIAKIRPLSGTPDMRRRNRTYICLCHETTPTPGPPSLPSASMYRFSVPMGWESPGIAAE